MELTPHRLRQQLVQLPAARRYWVAFSGGRDSYVLLHCLHALAAESAMVLRAVHVHHGLHTDADQWARHCAQICADLGVDLDLVEVDARPAPGQSPEAAAREARYRVLAERLAPGEALLTAHHRNDQAETLLLQLLRGAGPRGLAAMPAHSMLGAGLHLRPLLVFSGATLAAYAERFQLRWIEDPSNRDLDLDRNFLRHRIGPVLAERWPAWDATLARAAANSAETAALADQLAALDLQHTVTEDPAQLNLSALRRLDETRQRNVVRAWVRELGLPTPSRVHLQRVFEDVIEARADAEPVVHWDGVEVRRYRDRLFAMAPLAAHDSTVCIPWRLGEPLELIELGLRLSAVRGRGRGVRAEAFPDGCAQVRFRRGGERLRPAGCAHQRALKSLFQERGVTPWQRARIPLLYVGDQLAAVGSLWIEDRFAATADEWGLKFTVQPLRSSECNGSD